MFEDMKVCKDDVRGMGVIVSKLHVDGAVATSGIASFFKPKLPDEQGKATCQETESNKLAVHGEIVKKPHGGLETVGAKECDASSRIDCAVDKEYDSDDGEDAVSVEVMNLSQSSATSSCFGNSARKVGRRSLESQLASGSNGDKLNRHTSPESVNVVAASPQREKTELADDGLCNVEGNISTPLADDPVDEDFEIPSLSQLHMSQVAALPSPMRRKIRVRIEESKAVAARDIAEPMIPSNRSAVLPEPLYRQTDLKRMMRLAAVKTGQAPIMGTENISLTQLERLPIEIQLQVANHDSLSLGKQSPEIKKNHPKKMTSSVGNYARVRSKVAAASNAVARVPALRKVDDRENFPENDDFSFSAMNTELSYSDSDFFKDNILPLSTFLDETIVSDDSLEQLRDFFSSFIADHSWYHVVLMLKSIRRRGDDWSRPQSFLSLFNSLNEIFREETGEDLCLLQLF
jgi:hypothetical protein